MSRPPHRPPGDPPELPLATYLREIRGTPLLGREEEQELARRVEGGDGEARERMVRANLRLVVSLARGYAGRGLPLEDLVAEGNLGLLRAVEGFDPDRGTRFSTYAGYWIKQSIQRALARTARAIRLPASVAALLARWRRASTRLQEELGRPPTQEEIARSLNLPRKKLNSIKEAIRVSNSAPPSDHAESGFSLDEMLVDGNTRTPDTEMVEADDLHHVLDLLKKMDTREAAVLRMRFGLEGEGPKTLKEVGARLGLTRERVRQIESEALARLRRRRTGAAG